MNESHTVLRKIYRYTQGPLPSPFLLPFSPLPSFLLSPPLPFFPSSPLHPRPAVRSRCSLFQLGSLEEHCKLPQRGLGRSQNQFWSILALKLDIWWQQWFSWESTRPMPKFYPLPAWFPLAQKLLHSHGIPTRIPIVQSNGIISRTLISHIAYM